MSASRYYVPSSTLYRRVQDEVVVIQVDKGIFYFFNPETERFLDHFKSPRTVSSYLARVPTAERQNEEAEYLGSFCRMLLENDILRETADEEVKSVTASDAGYDRPVFLRHGDKTLDQIALTSA